MAKLKPFKGLMYNVDKIEDASKVISLPYDKISPEQWQKYVDGSEFNIAQVILGKKSSLDTEDDNRYTRAQKTFDHWIKENIIKEDDAFKFYIYEQEYCVPETDKTLKRTALMAMVELEEFSKKIILPHEKTLSGPKKDRLELMRKTGMNFGQIFGLFKDSKKHVLNILDSYKTSKPYFSIKTSEEGVRHSLWHIDNEKDVALIQDFFEDKQIYIADGHHRYTTAINYRDELAESSSTPNPMSRYRLMSLVAAEDEGMIVLPTHRLIHSLKNFDPSVFLKKLETYFDIEIFENNQKDTFLKKLYEEVSSHRIGFSLHKNENYHLLQLKDNDAVKDVLNDLDTCLSSLDVVVLHDLILAKIMDISLKDIEEQACIKYKRSFEEALALSQEDTFQVAFFLRPTTVKQVMDVADKGEYMPQKSTDFFPKLYTGIIMSKVSVVNN
ncbi:hypothetical protein AB834_04190 [PVC group bacterium (ex Bugula neritina AB1)]|nr:hypothetical protein AB834_04190 [PVC group bacterium (ex Bugula neritina AB1)]